MPGMSATAVLLLEDDPAIAHTVAYALQRDGLELHAVSLMREARHHLATGRYAAAVLDIGLPDGNGLDLCRELRDAGNTLPIILLSARHEELDRVLGLEMGADDYLIKPFSPRELVARVRALLRRSRLPVVVAPAAVAPGPRASAAAHASTHPGAVHIDPEAPQARVGDQWVGLTRLEHRLLGVLLRRPGKVWTRAALLDAVWGQDATSSDRTVDTHIKTLRAKLRAAAGGVEHITTHRGLGYAVARASAPAEPP